MDRGIAGLGVGFSRLLYENALSLIVYRFHSRNAIPAHGGFQTHGKTPANRSLWRNSGQRGRQRRSSADQVAEETARPPASGPARGPRARCPPRACRSPPCATRCPGSARPAAAARARRPPEGPFALRPLRPRAVARPYPRPGPRDSPGFHPRGLTGKAWLTAADVALGLVVAEGRRQAWDAAVAAGPGAFHAVTPGEAGAAAALPDVLLAAGTRVACGEPRGEGV